MGEGRKGISTPELTTITEFLHFESPIARGRAAYHHNMVLRQLCTGCEQKKAHFSIGNLLLQL